MLFSFDLSSLNVTEKEKISKASFILNYDAWEADASSNAFGANMHRITKSWDENTVEWDSFGENKNSNDYFNRNGISRTEGRGEQVFDLTGMVKFWIEYPDSNFGFVLKYNDFITDVQTVFPNWSATAEYNLDDIVTHNGTLWRAKWWSQGVTPGEDAGDGGCPWESWNFNRRLNTGMWLTVNIHPHGASIPTDPGKLAKLEIEYDASVSINSGNITNLKENNSHFSWEKEKLTIGKNSLCKNVKIYTINGVLVKSLEVSGDNRVLNYSNLAKGLYLFQFLTNNNRPLFNKKVVVH